MSHHAPESRIRRAPNPVAGLLRVIGLSSLLALVACDGLVDSGGSKDGGRPSAGGGTGRTGGGGGGSANTGGGRGGGGGGDASEGVGGGSSGGGSGDPVDAGTPPLVCPDGQNLGANVAVDASGVTFTLGNNRLRLQVCQEDIIRVQYASGTSIPTKTSLSVNANWAKPSFCVAAASGGVSSVTITTARIKAKVDTTSGLVTFTDLTDAVILAEDAKTLTAAKVEGTSTFKVETTFKSPASEALYGLGQHQDGVMNRKGTHERLENVNTQINIPVLISNLGYGLFWDNYSISDFYGNDSSNTKYRYVSEAGDQVDYYFFYGPSLDRVQALYRITTGAAPLLPKWAYGLFQSKDKYSTQSELLAVKDGYRKNNIPLDAIVQDWDYWTPYLWGSHLMDEGRYKDPAALITQLHADNVHAMISIWPLYQTGSTRKAGELDNYSALEAVSGLFGSGGSHHFYNPFNAQARTLVYKQIHDRLLGKYGWDAIWADNTEPQAYPDPVNIHSSDTGQGKGAFFLNAYALQHSRALYEGWRSTGQKDKRVYVLTRSGFAGQQRYSASCWSGDIGCDFPTLSRQINAGLNFAATGMPYWTTDIGGYTGHSLDWSSETNSELFTRWFQYGAFCPIFRIHGGGSRELYGNQWNATTKANLLKVDTLRYRLMPYIYSLAWKVTSEGYTMMRHLVFDYPTDTKVLNIKDQFLFGPAFLVNPVTTAKATSRSVYLPAGTWYDFWTGETSTGGSSSSVPAPLSQMPLFVKAGSIVPMGPSIQYATQSIDPLEIRVYKGKDATFTIYEDAGDSYDYETGKYSLIKLTWNEANQSLTIGARTGTYPSMPASRTFNVVWVAANHGTGVEVTATSGKDKVVPYTGAEVVVNAK